MIGKDQTCGVPIRLIGENVSFLRDVVDACTRFGFPCALLSLDQEKGFDRVDWHFLCSTLSAMGYGPSFMSWVLLFLFPVHSMLRVLSLALLLCLLGCGRVVPFPSFLIFWWPKSWLVISPPIQVSLAWLYLGLPYPFHVSPPVWTTPVSLYLQVSPFSRFSTYIFFLKRGTGAKLNLAKCKGLWMRLGMAALNHRST